MQENRLSAIQVAAPATEQDLTSSTEGDVLTSSTSAPITTDSTYPTTTSDAWYSQTQNLTPVTSAPTEISTGTDRNNVDIGYKSYFIPALQMTADGNVTMSTEPLDNTTENPELTSVRDTTAVGDLHVSTVAVEEGVSMSTVPADELAVAFTTHRWLPEGGESDVGLAHHEGDANVDIPRPESEDGTLAESVAVQGNSSESTAEESKPTDDSLQADNRPSSQVQSASAIDGDNSHLLHKESSDYGGSEAAALDYIPDVTSTEATDAPATQGPDTTPCALRYITVSC
jgi:hypothetical protein